MIAPPFLGSVRRPILHCSVLLAIGIIGCGEPSSPVTHSSPVPPDLGVAPGIIAPDAERAELGRLARSVAIALSDPEIRQRLKNDLRAAPFAEHKLELSKYLQSDNAGTLLDGMAAPGGKSRSQVLGGLQQLRSVEFYMPVTKHRETWTGDGEILVAAQLKEHDPIMAFNSQGEPVPMDEATVPSQPTLVLVSSETRFDKPMSPLMSRNTNDKNGTAIGTLVPVTPEAAAIIAPCIDCGGDVLPPPPPPPAIAPGLYLEFSRILDAKEPWPRGAPEVEVHIHAENGTPGVVNDLSCSGADVRDSRKYFDQNDGFWSGRVLLFSSSEVAATNGYPTTPYNIIYWEDDNTSCVLKLDSPVLRNYLNATLQSIGAAGLVFYKTANWAAAGIAFVGAFYHSAGEWLLTNDDFIGDVVPSTPGRPNYYPDNTHIIMNGGTLNGRVNLAWH